MFKGLVLNVYRNHHPSTFTTEEERAGVRQTMHYLFDTFAAAAQEHERWAQHTCCDWLPSIPLAVEGEPTVCPCCGEPLLWA